MKQNDASMPAEKELKPADGQDKLTAQAIKIKIRTNIRGGKYL